MRLIGVYPSSRTACGGNMLRAVEDAIVELILDTWQPVEKVAADVRRLSHRFLFRGNLSLVTSAATGGGIFQRAASARSAARFSNSCRDRPAPGFSGRP